MSTVLGVCYTVLSVQYSVFCTEVPQPIATHPGGMLLVV
jgi:hypothetical protein